VSLNSWHSIRRRQATVRQIAYGLHRTKKTKTSPTKLAVGDKLPSINLKDDKDVDVDVSTLENVVFFVYPKVSSRLPSTTQDPLTNLCKADTPGCTTWVFS